MTAAAERGGERALRHEPRERIGMMQHCQRGATALVVRTALDADHSLTHSWQRQLDVELLRDVVGDAETLESGAGQQDRIEFALVEAAQPGIDVAAQQFQLQVGTRVAQLRLATRARRADACAARQVCKTPEAALN